jgi:hypothetical protein
MSKLLRGMPPPKLWLFLALLTSSVLMVHSKSTHLSSDALSHGGSRSRRAKSTYEPYELDYPAAPEVQVARLSSRSGDMLLIALVNGTIVNVDVETGKVKVHAQCLSVVLHSCERLCCRPRLVPFSGLQTANRFCLQVVILTRLVGSPLVIRCSLVETVAS